MNDLQVLITISAIVVGTALTRFVPFILFPDGKKKPAVITYLSRVLPYSVMGLLVVYCLKSVAPTIYPHGIPEMISVALVALIHYKFSKTLLSIAAGTVVYMILIQFVFV